MRNRTHWAIARDMNTMGVTAAITLDPTKITPRIKAKVVRWLRQGFLEGGYRSEARKICDLIVDTFALEAVSPSWGGLLLENPSAEACDLILPILKADWCSFVLEHPHFRGGYLANDFAATVARLEKRLPGTTHVRFQDRGSRSLAGKITGELANKDQKALLDRAVSALMGTNPIPINYTTGDQS